MFRPLAFALLSFSLACSAQAEDRHDHDAHVFSAGGIEVIHPWARAAARGADSLVFFELHVEGEADRLVSARTSVAGEVHIGGLTVGADGAGHREVGRSTFQLVRSVSIPAAWRWNCTTWQKKPKHAPKQERIYACQMTELINALPVLETQGVFMGVK